MLRIRSPQIGRHVIAREALLLPLVLYLVHVRIELRQLGRAHQHSPLARGGVHIPKLALLALVIALHKRKLAAIRTPRSRFRSAPAQSPRLKHRFDRQRFGGSGLGLGWGKSGQAQQERDQDEATRILALHEEPYILGSKRTHRKKDRVYTAKAQPCTASSRFRPDGCVLLRLKQALAPAQALGPTLGACAL